MADFPCQSLELAIYVGHKCLGMDYSGLKCCYLHIILLFYHLSLKYDTEYFTDRVCVCVCVLCIQVYVTILHYNTSPERSTMYLRPILGEFVT